MALICRVCGSDQVETLADREKCLACGEMLEIGGAAKAPHGLRWTSPRPEPIGEDPPVHPAPVVLKNQTARKTGGDALTGTQTLAKPAKPVEKVAAAKPRKKA